MRTFWKIVYYGFAIHLSKSTVPFFGQFAKRLRRRCAKHLFARCGADLNIEQGAYFGAGNDFSVANHVGLGKNFVCHNRIVTIDDYLVELEANGVDLNNIYIVYYINNKY